MNQRIHMYSFYRQLLATSELFEQAHPDPGEWTMLRFATWLNQHLAQAEPQADVPFPTPGMTQEMLEGTISKLIGFMYRYAKVYMKKAIEGTALGTAEEFGFLALLFGEGSMSKTELIERGIFEKTSGMEIIRRLRVAGLLEQTEHPDDRRSKLVSVTAKGRQTMYQLFPRLQASAVLVAGDLADHEKWQLLYLLQKLDHFHRPIFMEHRDADLSTLRQKLP